MVGSYQAEGRMTERRDGTCVFHSLSRPSRLDLFTLHADGRSSGQRPILRTSTQSQAQGMSPTLFFVLFCCKAPLAVISRHPYLCTMSHSLRLILSSLRISLANETCRSPMKRVDPFVLSARSTKDTDTMGCIVSQRYVFLDVDPLLAVRHISSRRAVVGRFFWLTSLVSFSL